MSLAVCSWHWILFRMLTNNAISDGDAPKIFGYNLFVIAFL